MTRPIARFLSLSLAFLLSASLIGCSGSSSTASSAPPATSPTASLSVTSLAFPATVIGVTSSALTATITNTGTASLTFSSITLGGTNASAFAQTNTCGTTLAVNASCTISATFTPTAATTYTAAITATDNAATSPQTITLTGTGTVAPTPTATFSTTTLAFPNTTVGTTSAALSTTLTNTGAATLTIGSITLGGTNSSSFTQTNTCGTSLAPSATCTISATFKPQSAAANTATINFTDNAPNNPQFIALSGTGTAAPAPIASLSNTTFAFNSTTVGSTAAALNSTLTNTGNAALTISSIMLAGTNPSDFAETTTCGSSLAASSTCTISATFTPAATTSYYATISLTDNATGSPQTINLSGTGTAVGATNVSHQLYVFPESDNSVTPLYNFINSATKTIDMTMYEMQDTTFTADLVAACAKAVRVRVIFSSSVASSSTTAYNALNSAGTNCSAVYSNSAFTNTHQKTITIDGALATAQSAIMSLNLQSQYYSTTRDFAMITNDTADIAAIEATFNQDYAAGGTNSTTEFAYVPPLGDDLIWSPTTAQTAMVNLIANAKSTLLIENEELASSAGYIINALVTACQNGVQVHFAIVDQSSYEANFTTLENAGCGVHVYPDTTTGFYVHAKAVVADYGLSTQSVYMGSINYSDASMNHNRELGMYIYDAPSISTLQTTMTIDYNGGKAY